MSLKSLLVAAAATLALTTAAMAGNSASIYSEGDGNANSVMQQGRTNNGQIWSTGNRNDNYIAQRGRDNEAGIRSVGHGNVNTAKQRQW